MPGRPHRLFWLAKSPVSVFGKVEGGKGWVGGWSVVQVVAQSPEKLGVMADVVLLAVLCTRWNRDEVVPALVLASPPSHHHPHHQHDTRACDVLPVRGVGWGVPRAAVKSSPKKRRSNRSRRRNACFWRSELLRIRSRRPKEEGQKHTSKVINTCKGKSRSKTNRNRKRKLRDFAAPQ